VSRPDDPNAADALVLGAGGVAGIAWQLGLLAGLAAGGHDLTRADLVIGTSAGATVAAQITAGVPLEELVARQVDPALRGPELPPGVPAATRRVTIAALVADATSPAERRRRIAAAALRADTVAPAARRAVIAARLPRHAWPDADLRIVVVDATTGARRVLTRADGLPLVDAVAASCAVPLTWPPVVLDGRPHVDGGLWSGENADLAAGARRVVVLAPSLGASLAAGGGLAEQVAALRHDGTAVTVLRPDDAARAAIGDDPLDPEARAPAALAGREQGRALAAARSSVAA
jgi:NTE family protein